jgi:transposase-like protein
MAQHFLLSAQARTLSLKAIYAGGEDKAFATFRKLRWPQTDGEPVCPYCGSLNAYTTARRRFACKDCRKQYSVTSGTILASRKMAFVDLLAAICIIANGAKGISALQLARDLDCQHKTAFVLAHKIREALASESKGRELDGDVEVDGAYFGGHIRPANKAANRVDRRLAQYQTGKRRVVIAFRERKGRTMTFVSRRESDGVDIAKRIVRRTAIMHADEGSHWDMLHAGWQVHRINHSEAYCTGDDCTNQAESYFSRLRRMVSGQHHFVSPQYLHQYAAHAAWLEDHRREDNGALAHRMIGLAMAHPVSRNWKGYWQRSA